jgi:hypothetical protein
LVSITTEIETRVLVQQIHRADSDGEETVDSTTSDTTTTDDETVETTEDVNAAGKWVHEYDTEEDVVDGETSPADGGVTFQRTTTYTTETVTERRRLAYLFDVSDNDGFAESGWYQSAHLKLDLEPFVREGFTDQIDSIEHYATVYGLTRNTALPTTAAGFDALVSAAANEHDLTDLADPEAEDPETQYVTATTWIPSVATTSLLMLVDESTDNRGVQVESLRFAMANHYPDALYSGVEIVQDWKTYWDRDDLADFTLKSPISGPDFELDLRSLVYSHSGQTLSEGAIAEIEIIDATDAVLLTLGLSVNSSGKIVFSVDDDDSIAETFEIGFAAIISNPDFLFPEIECRIRKHIIEVIAAGDLETSSGTTTNTWEAVPIDHEIDFASVRLHVTAASGYKLGKLPVTPLIDPVENTNTKCPDRRTCEFVPNFGHGRFQVDDVSLPGFTENSPTALDYTHESCKALLEATGGIAGEQLLAAGVGSYVLWTRNDESYVRPPSGGGLYSQYRSRAGTTDIGHDLDTYTPAKKFFVVESSVDFYEVADPTKVGVRVTIDLDFPTTQQAIPAQTTYTTTSSSSQVVSQSNYNSTSEPVDRLFPISSSLADTTDTNPTATSYPAQATFDEPIEDYEVYDAGYQYDVILIFTDGYGNEVGGQELEFEKVVDRWEAGSEPTIAFTIADVVGSVPSHWMVTAASATTSHSRTGDTHYATHNWTVTQEEIDLDSLAFNVKPI